MPADWTIKAGDTQPAYQDNLSYSDGSVPPLAGATLSLQLRSLTNAAVTSLSGTATIVNPNTGAVQFNPTSADTAVPGNYLAEWEVVFASSTGLGTQRFPTDGFSWVSIEPNVSSPGIQVVDLATIKRYLNVTDRTRDNDLLGLLDAIAPLLESQIGPIVPQIYDEWYDGGTNMIQLLRTPSGAFGSNPLLQLIAASEYRGPIEYPLALVASPVFGSIYSVMLTADDGTITRRTAGGRTLAFMPGRQSVHVLYRAGQSTVPENVKRAAMEAVRIGYRWSLQTGRGSMSPADAMEVSAAMGSELSRLIRLWTTPTRRHPSFA